jgi:GntR family histidine utilization transcriptional repressor
VSEVSIASAIRGEVEAMIRSGAWAPGARIPTEHALMARYGCARMTVHKVLAGFAERGLIVRRRGAGSFVAAAPAASDVLRIADFAAEAARGGRRYRHEVVRLGREIARDGAFAEGEALVGVECLHLFDDVPIAWEDRAIRIASLPAVTRKRFRSEPPGPWLLRRLAWSEAEHEITAAIATPEMAARLAVRRGSALLCLRRRTWHDGALVTEVRFAFPGGRHSLSGRFTPG